MAGEGRRFGDNLPKQFHRLGGKKIYLHTLECFLQLDHWNEIILVVPERFEKETIKDVAGYPQKITVITGGRTRQESSYKALLASHSQYVVIHDGVRPFVSKQILEDNCHAVIKHKAVDTCIPSHDTIVQVDNSNIQQIPERKKFWRGQTPQSFLRSLIIEAHQSFADSSVTDDCSLVLLKNHPVHVVIGDESNIKITSELDLFIADQLLRLKTKDLTFDNRSLNDSKYVVIGGSKGIGRAICEELELQGAKCLSLSRHSTPYSVDVGQWENVKDVLSQIANEWGAIDGLINCAGLLHIKSLKELDINEIQNLINTNLNGVMYACKFANMRPGGHIVNIASSSYTRGRKNYAVYSSAKAGVVNFTQGFAEEHPELNINVIVPSRTDTSMRAAHFPDDQKDELLQPKNVAKTVINLLKHERLSGQIINVRKDYD